MEGRGALILLLVLGSKQACQDDDFCPGGIALMCTFSKYILVSEMYSCEYCISCAAIHLARPNGRVARVFRVHTGSGRISWGRGGERGGAQRAHSEFNILKIQAKLTLEHSRKSRRSFLVMIPVSAPREVTSTKRRPIAMNMSMSRSTPICSSTCRRDAHLDVTTNP